MAAPAFRLHQTFPTCSPTQGGTLNTAITDRGNMLINADCCRSYGPTVILGTTTLHLEGTLPACGKSTDGPKTFSSDSYNLCGGRSFTGSHTGGGTVSGAAFSGTGSGTLNGGRTGPYTVTLSGSFTSPGNGSYAGVLSGGLTGTFTGTIVGGVAQPITYVITTPAGAVVTGTGGGFTVVGGGFTFNASFSGLIPAIRGYLKAVWSSCRKGGVVAQELTEDDDTVVAEWANDHYAVRLGAKTILNRRSVRCAHPCIEAGHTPAVVFGRIQPAICFSTGPTQPTCLGYRGKMVKVQVGEGGLLAAPVSELAGSVDWRSGAILTVDNVGFELPEETFECSGVKGDGFDAGEGLEVSIDFEPVEAAGPQGGRGVFHFRPCGTQLLDGEVGSEMDLRYVGNSLGLGWINYEFLNGGATVEWFSPAARVTVIDPVTELPPPGITNPIENSTVYLRVSAGYRWSGTPPELCDDVTLNKTDEVVYLEFTYPSGFFTLQMKVGSQPGIWVPGSINHSSVMPDTVTLSPDSSNSFPFE